MTDNLSVMTGYNPFSLEGKKILVTGASSGIGRAVAIECAKAGASILITGRDPERLQQTLEALHGSGHTLCVADLNREQDRTELLSRIGMLDGAVLAAGINRILPFQFIGADQLAETFDTNFFSPVFLSQQLVKGRKIAKGGAFVMISSIEGNVVAHIGHAMYSASKSALSAIARNMALELAPRKIRVNCVLPGMVETPLIRGTYTDDQLEADMQKYPLKRYGTPEEVAYAVQYLLSDASAWVTGTQLVIDGGFTL